MIEQKHCDIRIISEGRPLPTHQARGTVFVEAPFGLPFEIEVRNKTNRRMEVVIGIDGKSIMTGKNASPSQRGYIISAYQTEWFDGWRLNDGEVAEFEFGTKPGSYAAQMEKGDTKNVGIVGVATFLEKVAVVVPRRLIKPAKRRYRGRINPDMSFDKGVEEKTSGGLLGQVAPASFNFSSTGERGTASGQSLSYSNSPNHVLRSLDISKGGDLGTGFGDVKTSAVTTTKFVRDRATRSEFTFQYATHENLVKRGIIRSQPAPDAWPGRKPTGSGCTPPPNWRRH
tara:strand:- start:608 stop:1462 length:855 start_codon:yes stop_codon:yes gene_type:complete